MDKKEAKYFINYLIEFFLYVQDEMELNENDCKKIETEKTQPLPDSEEYISLVDFFLQTRICTAGTISRLLSNDKELYETCAKFENGKYFVKTDALLNFLALYGSDKMKKRIKNYFISQEEKVFPRCYC